jgi:hypothetical protein
MLLNSISVNHKTPYSIGYCHNQGHRRTTICRCPPLPEVNATSVWIFVDIIWSGHLL